MMKDKVSKVRDAFNSGKTKPIAFRRQQLEAFLKMVNENTEEMVEALQKDLRKSRFETLVTEVTLLKNDIIETLMHLDNWTAHERPARSFQNWLDSVYIIKDPYGVVLIIGAWNYPLQLLLLPVVGAIAAGNCVIMKPSELAPATAQFIEKTVPKYLDNSCYTVINGGINETTELLKERFDYIFFTGSTNVGKIVHKAASQFLTPVTLELGGKSPVYIDDSVNLKIACKRLLWGKYINMGQTCIAPDYILCTKEVEKAILKLAPEIFKEFYGENPQLCKDLGRIVNERNFNRLNKLLTSGKIALGGQVDAADLFIAPTILSDVSESDPVMQDEIFGPIFPIVNIKNVKEAIKFINEREKPLAMYIFSRNKATVWDILNNTSCGGVCVNDTLMHFTADGLPFGGVGSSGMGSYHGKYSFDTFTHKKSCLYKNYNPIGEALASGRYLPFSSGKLAFLSFLIGKRRGIPLKYIPQVLAFGLGLASAFVYQKYYVK